MVKPWAPESGASQPLPMDAIWRSVAGFNLAEWPAPREAPQPPTAVERSLLHSLYEYFSSEVSQRIWENVVAVAMYLLVSFGDDSDPLPPEHFDWGLIDKISPASMSATFGLFYLILAGDFVGCERLGEHAPLALARAAALRQEEHHRSRLRLAAANRHAEDRAMKQEVIDAFLHGDFANKNKAAEAIAGQVVPMSFDTVRGWLKGVTK